MIAELARETERMAIPLDFPRAIPTQQARRPAQFASVAALLLIGHVTLYPQAFGAWVQRRSRSSDFITGEANPSG